MSLFARQIVPMLGGSVGGGFALPLPEFVGFTQTTAVSTIDQPAETAVGDLLVGLSVSRNRHIGVGPDGWTEAYRHVMTGSGNNEYLAASWTYATVGGSLTHTWSSSDSGTDGRITVCAAFRYSSDLRAWNLAGGNTAPSVDGVADGLLVGHWGSALEGGSYDGPPPGMTEVWRGAGPAGTRMLVAFEVLEADGETGTRTPPTTSMTDWLRCALISFER